MQKHDALSLHSLCREERNGITLPDAKPVLTIARFFSLSRLSAANYFSVVAIAPLIAFCFVVKSNYSTRKCFRFYKIQFSHFGHTFK